MERRVTIDHAVANAKVEVGASTATASVNATIIGSAQAFATATATSATASATTTADQPQPALGIKCEGCDDFSCTSAMAEWTAIVGDEAARIMQQTDLSDKHRWEKEAIRAADDACTLWLSRHHCFYKKFKCVHADETISLCEPQTVQGVKKLRCPNASCSVCVELMAPLPITKPMKAYKVMVVFFCYIRGRRRKDISESTGIRSGTVGDLFSEFEKIFATEEFHYGAHLNDTLARDEVEEVLSGVRAGMRQHVQADETTWGAAKCGRGKPAHKGATQWFQK